MIIRVVYFFMYLAIIIAFHLTVPLEKVGNDLNRTRTLTKFELSDSNSTIYESLVLEFCEENDIGQCYCRLLLERVKLELPQHDNVLVSVPAYNANIECHNCLDVSYAVFIHGIDCKDDACNTAVEYLLLKVEQSGIFEQEILVFVMSEINLDCTVSFMARFPEKIIWVPILSIDVDIGMSGLNTMQAFSRMQSGRQVNILYMHTKRFSGDEQVNRNWIDMMLYMLLERFQSCHNLLLSKLFDAIGTDYVSAPVRMFQGNFWWSTSKYIAQLPYLSGAVESTAADAWLLSGERPRVYVSHASSRVFGAQLYPRSCYAVNKSYWADKSGSGGRDTASCGEARYEHSARCSAINVV